MADYRRKNAETLGARFVSPEIPSPKTSPYISGRDRVRLDETEKKLAWLKLRLAEFEHGRVQDEARAAAAEERAVREQIDELTTKIAFARRRRGAR